MKQLNVTFEDAEYILLLVAKEKSNLAWREFILSLIKETPTQDLLEAIE